MVKVLRTEEVGALVVEALATAFASSAWLNSAAVRLKQVWQVV